MAEKESPKPTLRVVLWEAAAAYGMVRLLQTGSAQDPWTIRFTYNACFFLVAYPFMALWRYGGVPGLLKFILFPLGILLRLGLAVSAYLWTAFLFWTFHRLDLLDLMFKRPTVLGVLFLLLYWFWIGRLWGSTGRTSGAGALARLALFGLGAGAVGFLVGRGMDVTLAARHWAVEDRLWVTAVATLLFALVGAWVGKVKQGKA